MPTIGFVMVTCNELLFTVINFCSPIDPTRPVRAESFSERDVIPLPANYETTGTYVTC